jgi:peroxidase
VLLGRRDGTTTNIESANNLPSPFDPLDKLQEKFRNFNLDATDLVALQGNQSTPTYQSSNTNSSSLEIKAQYSVCLVSNLNIFAISTSGAHTFGKVQCQFTQQNCTAGQSSGALENLDQVTPKVFDNKYYNNLLEGRAQLRSDQVMLSDPSAAATTAPIVHRFAGNQQDFFRNFAASMIKMGNISPLTGKDGEIRNNCRRVNKRY